MKNSIHSPKFQQARMDSPLRSPLQDVEDPIPPSPQRRIKILPGRGEGAVGSPLRSPLRSAETPIPQKNLFSSHTDGRSEGAMGSPLRSPLPDAEDPIPPSPQWRSPILPGRGEGAMGSPLRSPLPNPQNKPFISHTDGRREGAIGSPLQSPIPDTENPIPHRSPLISQFAREGTVGSPLRSPLRENSDIPVLRPPLRDADSTIPLQLPPPQETEDRPAAAVVANRLLRDELAVMTKAEEGGGRLGTRGEGYGSAPAGERGSRVVSGIVRRAAVNRAAVVLRVSAVVLSLVAFSVMAADKTKGWAGDSFDRYKEFRYCVSVNVIAFVYSSFQLYALVHRMIKREHIIVRPIRYYFDFSMDQILAYLLISASSSAATRNDAWVSMFGSDDFTDMANGSIAMSFLAFVALGLSSLISAYHLFRRST